VARGVAGPAASDQSRIIARSGFSGFRLLLAEDNPINQEVALELLREAGFSVTLAKNGLEVVELARQTVYDLLLMDVQMPGLDGLEATQIIRALPSWAEVPILAMTASAFAEDRQRCLYAGMNDHVSKPVDPDQLLAALLKWLPAAEAMVPVAPATGASKRVEPDNDDIITHLNGIAGFDSHRGLQIMRGQVPSYLRLLRKYLAIHHDDMRVLRAQLAQSEILEAERLLHTLKGAAGSIGATRIQSLAADLERMLHGQQGSIQMESQIRGLAVEMESLAATLLAILPPEFSAEATQADYSQINDLLAQLENLLLDDDMQVNTLWRNSAAWVHTALGDQADELTKLIESFNYSAALSVVHSIQASMPQRAEP
jgi:CheY-like chemotaxis protein/HPt (histidine-containing phosphotransfer) domain-containing protein